MRLQLFVATVVALSLQGARGEQAAVDTSQRVTEGDVAPVQAVAQPSAAKSSFPRDSWEVCLQIDVPTCTPGLTASIGIAGSMESDREAHKSAASRGFKSVAGALSLALEGDLLLGKFYGVLEGEITVSSPSVSSHKDLMSAMTRALLIKWFRRSSEIDGSHFATFSKAAVEERKFIMEALQEPGAALLDASGELSPARIDQIATGFDVMRAEAESCVTDAHAAVMDLLQRDTPQSIGREITKNEFNTATWDARVKKYKGFGEPKRWWQFWKGVNTSPPASVTDWRTWSVLAANVQLELLRLVRKIDSCVMDTVLRRTSEFTAGPDECANVPVSKEVRLETSLVEQLNPTTKTILMNGGRTLPASVKVYPRLMCLMLRAAPDTSWMTDAAEEARMADADTITEADRAAASAAAVRSTQAAFGGASGSASGSVNGVLSPHTASAVGGGGSPAAVAPTTTSTSAGSRGAEVLGRGHAWEGTTPGSTSDQQLEAMERCRAALARLQGTSTGGAAAGAAAAAAGTEAIQIPDNLEELPEECAVLATTGPSRELLDRDDDAREEALLTSRGVNVQRAEFSDSVLWSRTFPDINTMKNSPCTADQLDPTKPDRPEWCYVRVSHAASELLHPILRDLRFAFNKIAAEIRAAEDKENTVPSAPIYRKATQRVHALAMDALRPYDTRGWTKNTLAVRRALVPADGTSAHVPHSSDKSVLDRPQRAAIFTPGDATRNVLKDADKEPARRRRGIQRESSSRRLDLGSSLIQVSEKIKAGTRLRHTARAAAATSSKATIAHRLGARYGGWLVDSLADTEAAMRERLEAQAREMDETEFAFEFEYSAVLSLTFATGVSSVGLCTPDTNLIQARVAVGIEQGFSVTSTGRKATAQSPAGLVKFTPGESKVSSAIEFTGYPKSFVGFSLMYSAFSGAASTQAFHQHGTASAVASKGKGRSMRFSISLFLQPKDIGMTTASFYSAQVGERQLNSAAKTAADLIQDARGLLSKLMCMGNGTCETQLSQERSRTTAGRTASTDLTAEELDSNLSEKKAASKKKKWKESFKQLIAGAAEHASSSVTHRFATDCSLVHLVIDISRQDRPDGPAISVAARLMLRTQVSVPIGFKHAARLTIFGLRGTTFDLKDQLTKALAKLQTSATASTST